MNEKLKKLIVNKNCIGCGACVAIASDVFDLDDEGISFVKDGIISYEGLGVEDAIGACPVDAIVWQEISVANDEFATEEKKAA